MQHRGVLICSIALLVLIQAAALIYIEPFCPDSQAYLQLSHSLYERGSFSYDGINPCRYRAPLYPLYLVLFYQLPGKNLTILLLSQVLLNLLTFFFILKTAALVFRTKSNWVLPLLTAAYFPVWVFSSMILTETLFIFLTTASIYYLISALRRYSLRNIILCGILSGLAFLTRPIGIGAIFLFPVMFLVFIKNKLYRPIFLKVTLCAVCVLLPWSFRNYLVLQEFTIFPSDVTYHLYYCSLSDDVRESGDYIKYHPDSNPDKLADSLKLSQAALINIKAHPFDFIGNGISKIVLVWINFPGTRDIANPLYRSLAYLMQFFILALLCLALIRNRTIYTLALLFPAVGFTLVIAASYATTRFIIPAMPLILILISDSLQDLMKIVADKIKRPLIFTGGLR